MAKKAKKKTSLGRKQDRARVAGDQDYEVYYKAIAIFPKHCHLFPDV
jgi:hypothetical protein